MTDELLVQHDGAVATLIMNRPAALNALNVNLKVTLRQALEEVSADDRVRAVVLTGSGRGFCVGQDLREHVELLDTGDPAPLSTVTDHYNPLLRALATAPKPVIAAVNGAAAGAGAGLAYACDLRIAAESASFLLAFANVGLSLDSGVSWTLPRLIGSARATALSLLAEPVKAPAALEMGMVNAVVPDHQLLDSALEIATRLAAGPTQAYANIKAGIAFAASHSLDEALDMESELQINSGRTVDHAHAVRSFVNKERPTFIGR